MKRSTMIGGLVFGVAVPALAVIALSHTAKSGPEYIHALAFATEQPDVTEVHNPDGWRVTDATWYFRNHWKKLPTTPRRENP